MEHIYRTLLMVEVLHHLSYSLNSLKGAHTRSYMGSIIIEIIKGILGV